MNIWLKSLIAGSIAAVFIFFLATTFFTPKNKKEYDIEYLIQVESGKNAKQEPKMQEIIDLLEKRLEAGWYKFTVRPSGKDLIRVSVAEEFDTLSLRSLLTSSGSVAFCELYNTNELTPLLNLLKTELYNMESGDDSLAAIKDSRKSSAGELPENMEKNSSDNNQHPSLVEFSSPSTDQSGRTVFPPEPGTVKIKDSALLRKIVERINGNKTNNGDRQLCFGLPAVKKELQENDQRVAFYFLKAKGSEGTAILENEDIQAAYADFEKDGHPLILLEFNPAGTRKWARMTAENVGRHIAIIINGNIVSAPTVLSPIENGISTITGDYTPEECTAISIMISGPRLFNELHIVSSVIKPHPHVASGAMNFIIAALSFIILTILAFFLFKTLTYKDK